MRALKYLTSITILLALTVILLGAYTRLTDAGLGCPDWPGCYGLLHAPQHEQHIEQAQENFPGAKIEPFKARNEMIHRYLAGTLGLCVLAIFLFCQLIKRYRKLSGALLLLVILQAALGMWTVTLSLLPLIVLGHLLGGFSLLTLLALLRTEMSDLPMSREPMAEFFFPLSYVVLIILFTQILLGGWTSANYAAVVCYQLPFCDGEWYRHFSVEAAFSMPLGHTSYEYGVLPYEARMSIHVMHRIGAITTLLVLGSFCYWVWRKMNDRFVKGLACAVGGLLIVQCCLGVVNVLAQLPLANAVAHNLVAANLFMLTALLVRQLYKRRALTSPVASIIQQPVEG